jgi:hypothetical protein
VIRKSSLLVDGRTYGEWGSTSWGELAAYLGLSESVNYGWLMPNTVIAVGQTEELMGTDSGLNPADRLTLWRNALRRLTIFIDYDSCYGEHFRYAYRGEDVFPDNAA